MRVNNNVGAINAWRSLSKNDANLGKSLAKLSSGLRINNSSDDAGGLALSESLRATARGLAQAEKNSQDGLGALQTYDGALGQIHDMLQRMRELAVQSANGTYTNNDRTAMNAEYQALATEITRQATASNFNGTTLNAATLTFQIGSRTTDTLAVTTTNNNAATLMGAVGSITTAALATTAIGACDTGINTLNTNRANLGASMNKLESVVSNLQVTRENIVAAESRVRDTDMASELTNLSRSQILMQSSTAMLAQANAKPQNILALLQ